MNIVRTDNQAIAQELLQKIGESAEFYGKMAETVASQPIKNSLAAIARQRATQVNPMRRLVASLQDLPMATDTEREFFKELGAKLLATVSDKQDATIVQRCLESEQEIKQLSQRLETQSLATNHRALIDKINAEVETNIKALRAKIPQH